MTIRTPSAPSCLSKTASSHGAASPFLTTGNSLSIIGIVPTYKPESNSLELPDRYVNAIISAGGAPIVLPFTKDVSIYETLLPNIDGFLLSGGQDIDPVRYGERITYGRSEEIAPEREEVEYLIISFARQFDVPVLGICRGMQMINVAFGGTLYQDLTEEAAREGHWQSVDYASPTHRVTITPDSMLRRVLGADEFNVNSMHHQGIRDVASELRAAAYSEDGLVEAIEAPDLTFMIGVQWHPEFFVTPDATMAPLLHHLVAAADAMRNRSERCRSCLSIERRDCGSCFPDIHFD